MKGIRAFGKNEGGLSHSGDFVLLFSPMLPHLADVAAFHPEVTFSRFYSGDAPDNWEETIEKLSEELEKLDQRTPDQKSRQLARYYRPGFFPKFAQYIQDDWNEILCFKSPFPDYASASNVSYSKEHETSFRTKDYSVLREQYRSLRFFAYFRNIDACWWEFYTPHDELRSEVRRHLAGSARDFEELDFDTDYPFGGLKKQRKFAGVHTIWPPEKEQNRL